ncbi:monocarboxylate transporter 13-like [Acanthaster planci]|uniref:Monocarboxylate transporter 13-like n=1 Tax=Acanthaster planci TaxID=133434 RepID=A0A8B7Y262_ACAPL|nr:monocarboxylate transporter 13-like [Acanthaster planci]
MAPTDNQLYSEGGWGWIIVLATFFSKFIVFGSLKAFGVLLKTVAEDLETQLWVVGSICALHFGVQFTLSPVTAMIAYKVGSRCVVVCGGVVYGLGLVLASLSSHVTVFAASVVLLAGTGAACVINPVHAEVNFFFSEKYALVSIIALGGNPLGMMLYGPVAQLLLDTYGWRGAMLLLGGAGFFLITCGMVIRRPSSSYSRIVNEDEDDRMDDVAGSVNNSTIPFKMGAKTCSSFLLITGFDIFFNLDFLLLSLSRMLYAAGYGGLIVYMVSNGLSLGLSPNEASYLTVAWGIGNLAGLTTAAIVLHTKLLPYYSTAVIGGAIAALCMTVDSVIPTFSGQMIIMLLTGFGFDVIVEVNSVRTRCLPFGDDRFISVLGWQNFMAGFSSTVGGVFAGWLYDATASFQLTFTMLSATVMSSALCFLVEVVLKRQTQN